MPTPDGKKTWEEQQAERMSPEQRAAYEEYVRDPESIAGRIYSLGQGGLSGSGWKGSGPDVISDWLGSLFDPAAMGLAKGRVTAYSGTQPQVGLRNFSAGIQPTLQAGAQRKSAVNPYNTQVADQSRAAQMALMAQMRAQQVGPSLASMQGQRAVGQSGQMALSAAALGQGRSAMLGAGRAGVGIAADTGQGRLAEVMKAQASRGAVSAGMRGQDFRSAEAQQQSGIRAQELADQRARFYAAQGSGLSNGVRDANLEALKFYRRSILDKTKESQQTQADTAAAGTTLLGMFF